MKRSEVRSVRVDSEGRLQNWTADSYNTVTSFFSLYTFDDDSQPVFDKIQGERLMLKGFCKKKKSTKIFQFVLN